MLVNIMGKQNKYFWKA